jgi:hypothetical protein
VLKFLKKLFYELLDLFYKLAEPKSGHFLEWSAFWLSFLGILVSVYFFGGFFFHSPIIFGVIKMVMVFAPFFVPLILANILFNYYMRYIRAVWIRKEGSVLLEIKIPKETNKSPLAMEIFFTSLYQTGSATTKEAFSLGKVRPWFSFEIASIDGEVRFFIWALKKWRNLIEAQLYAQYPTIEIYEAEDYTKSIHHDPINLPMWGTYFTLEKEDVFPIKTYVDYGLDKLDTKEEFKIDPMTSVLEYLGSLKKGEQVWIQIIVQAHRKEKTIDGRFLGLKGDWKEEIDEKIAEIKKEATSVRINSDGEKIPGFPNYTPGQIETIKSLERSRDKFPFEAIIRGIYVCTKESFTPISITGLVGSFRQYNSANSNGFKLGWYTDPDEPWRDLKRFRRNVMEEEMLEAYKMRSFFQYPFKNFEATPMILMTEELATIFHFPGTVAGTPTLGRIPSKKSEPPTNLPC